MAKTWIYREGSIEKEVLDLLIRRPCRAVDISVSLRIDLFTAREVLKSLKERGRIETKIVNGEEFCFKRE